MVDRRPRVAKRVFAAIDHADTIGSDVRDPLGKSARRLVATSDDTVGGEKAEPLLPFCGSPLLDKDDSSMTLTLVDDLLNELSVASDEDRVLLAQIIDEVAFVATAQARVFGYLQYSEAFLAKYVAKRRRQVLVDTDAWQSLCHRSLRHD